MRVVTFLLLCLAAYSPLLLAASVDDLYQVREPLVGDSDVEQSIALSSAFDTLLLRLVPGPRTAGDTALTTLRQNPQPLIVRYSKQGQTLLVEFDPTSTLHTLREQGLPLWTGKRPLLLIWWLESRYGENNAALLGDSQAGSEALAAAAQYRALPLRLPLADLPEQLLIPEQDLDAFREAATRYHSDGWLLVHASDNGRQLEASWQLYLGEYEQSGTAIGIDRESLADMLLLAVSQRLAERLAIAPSKEDDRQAVTLEVRGATLEQYAELSRVLAPFSAKLLQMDSDKLLWQLDGSAETLRAHLSLMQLHEDEAPLEAVSGRLYFSW